MGLRGNVALKRVFQWCAACAFALSADASDTNSVSFRPVEIDQIEIGYGVAVSDVDGDKKPDILLADKRQVVWYQNPTWKKFIIAENLTKLDNVCIAAADVNGDGKAEVAVGAEWNPGDTIKSGAVFFLVAPKDRTLRWEPIKLHHEPTVHRMRWVKNLNGTSDLVVLPLHGCGNQDAAGVGVKILAYKMPDNPRQPWKTELIDDSLHKTHNFTLVDWTMGVDEELLVGSGEGVFRFVRRRESAGWNKTEFVGRTSSKTDFDGAGEVRTGKLPGGKDFIVTIEPMHGNEVAVYSTPSGDRPISFSNRSVIDASLAEGHALACGDLLGLGNDQVVAGWRGKNLEGKVGLKMFIPLNEEGTTWKTVPLDDTMACEDVCLADLNSDGRLDIVAAGRATRNLKVYFNESRSGGNR
jgi:hypothetical protein